MSDNNETLEIWCRISGQIGELNASVKSVLERLTNHEQRLTNLETKKEDDWKVQLLMLLAKATVIGLVSIGSLTGASTLIQKVLELKLPTAQMEQSK